MATLSQQALELHEPQDHWDTALEAMLIVLLVFAPLAFGSTDERGREVVLALSALMAVVLAAKHVFVRDARFIWSYAYLPIVLFVGLVLLQLVHLPGGLVAIISPRTAQQKAELQGDLPTAAALLRSMTLTCYPLATRRDLRMVLAVAAVFVVVVNVYRRPDQIKRLLWAVALIGLFVASLAAYQNLSGTHLIYGIRPMAHPNSGPFMNHGHFGQFMNLSIGAMLAILLIETGKITDGLKNFGDAFQRVRESSFKVIFLLAFGILFSVAPIFLSGTRGGVLSLVLAGLATWFLLAFRRLKTSFSTVLLVAAVGLIIIVMYVALGSVFERLATMWHLNQENTGARWELLKDLSAAWRLFPVFGTGLGTHQYIFPMFDRSTELKLAVHAENEYAELLEEAGGIGLLLCVLFIGMIASAYFRCVRQRHKAIHLAAYGLGFGLLAVLIHSFTDFGQHVPSNALLVAVFAGLLICLRRMGRSHSDRPGIRLPPWTSMPLRVGAALATVAAFAAVLPAADLARREESAWSDTVKLGDALALRGWQNASNEEFISLLGMGTRAAEIQPENVNTQYWLNFYRWQLVRHSGDPKTGVIVFDERSLGWVQRIVGELHAIRLSCETYAQPYSLAGLLERFVLNLPVGESHIRLGYRLDRCNPTACFAAASLDAQENRWEESLEEAHRATSLDKSLVRECLQLYVGLGRPDLAHQLVAGDRPGLLALTQLVAADESQKQLAAQCIEESDKLLIVEGLAPDAPATTLAMVGELYASKSDLPKAIEFYERALIRNYGQTDWRAALANLLLVSGRLDEAITEAKVCLQLRPRMGAAEAVISAARARQAGTHVQAER